MTTIRIPAAQYADHDDCLAAAAAEYAEQHAMKGWDLSPRWEDGQRDVILLDVPSTTAAAVAALLGDDGSNFTADDGREFSEVVKSHGGRAIHSRRAEPDEDGRRTYEEGSRSEYISGDPVRYVFPDGSVIVEAGDGWDYEGDTPFSWRG